MANTVKIEIKETLDELKELIKQSDNTKVKERLQVLYLLKSGQVTTLKTLSQLLLLDTSTLYRWLKQYREGGLSKLLDIYEPPGKSSTIPANIIEKLKEKLTEPLGFNSYKEIQDWLKSEHNVSVGYFVVYRVVRRLLKAKPKVPRPSSSKQDKAAVQRFKQDLANKIKLAANLWSWRTGEYKPPRTIRFWCQDEARVGLKTVVGRVITLRGVKPIRKVQWPRQAFYIYGLFEPETGESFYYEFSRLNSDCFQIFIPLFCHSPG